MNMQELIDWALALEPCDLPDVPFQLHKSQVVIGKDKFLTSIKRDIKKGPKGARARFGALQSDVKALWEICHED